MPGGQRRSRLVELVAVAALGLASNAYAQSSEFRFFVSVVDPASGTPVTALTPADIVVTEDNAAGRVLEIEPIDWPVKVAILVDNGTGAADRLVPMRSGLTGLIDALPDGVEISLVATAPQPRTVVKPTTDKQKLREGVDRIAPGPEAGRFVDGLIETAQRFEKERGNYFPVIVALGSLSAEGSPVREYEANKMLRTLGERAATVHAVMLAADGRSPTGGNYQTQVGLAATKGTGGRYESIAAASRLSTLLPEIGAQVARSHALQSHQFRVTLERPNKKSGAMGVLSIKTTGGQLPKLSIDGHLP